MSFFKKLFGGQTHANSEKSIDKNQSKEIDAEAKLKFLARNYEDSINDGSTLLEVTCVDAAKNYDENALETCRLLLKCGEDPNRYKKLAPIISIVGLIKISIVDRNKVMEVIKLLLEKGANPNVSIEGTSFGEKLCFDPLGIAVNEDAKDVALLLLEYGADPNFSYKNNSNYSVEKIKRFIDSNSGIIKSQTQSATSSKQIVKPKIEWVDIPTGTFIMGSPSSEIGRSDDEIQHQVELDSFKMSKYEVTFEQYDAFCDAMGRKKPSDEGWGRANRPVINVSWNDANDFAKWIDCRLPTEAEWEYACRAGTETPFNTGNELTTAQANFDEYCQQTMPVGRFSPNNYGLYDMHGNVWEWCGDWIDDYPKSIQNNPKGPQMGTIRARRGGCWNSSAQYCRSATRLNFILSIPPLDFRSHSIGLRLVLIDK